MFAANSNIQSVISEFRIDTMMRYSQFVPRLYNLCKSLGFKAGHIMPSRAFCSDENQGYPIILIAKHFGTFPFNHGMVGGIVASDRHGAHAHHGRDLVIIQASHVGYDPDSKTFGTYRRINTADDDATVTCGKVGAVIEWYQEEYRFAQNNIYLGRDGDNYLVTIDNQLLHEDREQGLFLHLDRLVRHDNGGPMPLRVQSTSHIYQASPELRESLPADAWPANDRLRIGHYLSPELFKFRRTIEGDLEGRSHLEQNLINPMPWIVTSTEPLLVAAQVNTQAEFDRAFRTIVREKEYQGKKVLFIACINIDISPREGLLFPLTKCVPWAAYIQDGAGGSRTLEQDEIVSLLRQQSTENPDQIDLEDAIQQMEKIKEIKIEV
ncbi:MAG: hypothetical protein BMS9Abin09_0462 [Gammaproteobacteria bacterium]|nr:MAG: hypothetical protein BMS9Abin09_0462 [Gammaproteobacteria bacterium]